MKKFLITVNILVLAVMATEARANDREVFGAVLGAIIGYQIAKSTAPQPQIVVQQDNRPVYDHRRNVYVDRRQPQSQGPCWTRLDRINSYGQPVYMQECHVN
jgi:hypothetical protein